ncbi:hypothetical protein FB451DRAFT_1171550 [Mycena latifolia]|nr:hypothetical protein FB451DRAFT_1171550 [Mycena latifolia]
MFQDDIYCQSLLNEGHEEPTEVLRNPEKHWYNGRFDTIQYSLIPYELRQLRTEAKGNRADLSSKKGIISPAGETPQCDECSGVVAGKLKITPLGISLQWKAQRSTFTRSRVVCNGPDLPERDQKMTALGHGVSNSSEWFCTKKARGKKTDGKIGSIRQSASLINKVKSQRSRDGHLFLRSGSNP